MEDPVPFASRTWFIMLGLLVFARGMDILSTRIATPNLVLEGNPIAKKLGWRWGLLFNAAFCLAAPCWQLISVSVATISLLVAAHNFKQAWLMHSMGEESYREWHVARILEARLSLYLFCLLGETALTALVGAAVMYFSHM